ncbi:MAG TPA: Arc family DNA-binding protein [Longimicrobium sp.]|nr:Arc family DNA-binding protein [Longimicrobium sp.]
MLNITIAGIPEYLLESFQRLAERNGRSLDAEIIAALEEKIRVRPRRERRISPPKNVEEELKRIRVLRESLNVPFLTPEMLEEWIDEGRPCGSPVKLGVFS